METQTASGATVSELRNFIRKPSLLSVVTLLGCTGQVARAAPPPFCMQGGTTYF
jgi:hypothetical protein